ncbi:acylphosphatase [Candidatus Sumerlaeota bacterium]|nr:acylphosphatase [Candidatus Sumerlaeota bacterium]
MPRKRLVVSGRVQGVGFRFFTLEEAERLGVAGWVRNRSDGAVEIEAQAPEPTLDAFVRVIGEGPAFGRVRSIESTDLHEVEGDSEFRIRF